MALGPRLDLRQSQSLVMTPQLQQAIKLLALSNLEIEAFIGDALENNPLLEAGELRAERGVTDDNAPEEPREDPTSDELMLRGAGEKDAPLDLDPTALDRDRDTGDGARGDGERGDWSAQLSSRGGEEGPSIDERGNDADTLAEHLETQVGPAAPDARTAFIARHIIGLLDEAGYLPVPLREVATDLGCSMTET